MRFFIALVVFAIGLGLYAAAALMFDRRRLLIARSAARRARAAGAVDAGVVTGPPVANPMPVYLTITGCLVLGTLLMVGSCAGVIVW
jgi:hypothetical protein